MAHLGFTRVKNLVNCDSTLLSLNTSICSIRSMVIIMPMKIQYCDFFSAFIPVTGQTLIYMCGFIMSQYILYNNGKYFIIENKLGVPLLKKIGGSLLRF